MIEWPCDSIIELLRTVLAAGSRGQEGQGDLTERK